MSRFSNLSESSVSSPFVEATGLVWTAGQKRIIDSVDLSVEPGELVGVIGPNGAGKTTLLRLISGGLNPTLGEVRLRGHRIGDMSARERARQVAYMSQDSSQALPFTVMDVLLMGRYPHLNRFEHETAVDRGRAREALAAVGMQGLENRIMNQLSGGERQLVLFAKALVQDTDVLVLDEPSSSLDIGHQDRIFSMAQDIARFGRTVIVSVHNLSVAAEYCTRLVLLENGTVAASGLPEAVIRSDLLDRVYAVRTLVSPNLATGSPTVTVVPGRARSRTARVHLIGGAGSAVNLTRELYRMGYQLSGGIAHEYDSDEKLWRSLALPVESVGAFSRVSDEDVARASHLVEEADVTILCSFPVGTGNLGNLRLAGNARRLFIVNPGPDEVQRDFFSAEAGEAFEHLCSRATMLGYKDIVSMLAAEAAAGAGQF
ncbi:MAG TPA: ATP-binding cassette domain-containing protein [Spirochaetia bacterium]|nr:ATP-binding cassette domain-containing protein [Spirochaetia bacterium]